MKEAKTIITYFEKLKADGHDIGPVNEETLARCYRIFNVALFGLLSSEDSTEEFEAVEDTFTEEEAREAMRKASFWG